MERDSIESMRDLLSLYSKSLKCSTIAESADSDLDFSTTVNGIKDHILLPKDELPNYVPMLTPKEMLDLELPDEMNDNEKEWFRNYSRTCMLSAADSMNYGASVQEAYIKWNNNPDEDNKRALLNMGWIPGIYPNNESFATAKDNLYEYIHTVFPKIIDLTNTTSKMSVVENAACSNLKPIFLICTYTGTTAGKFITGYTSSKYSHAAIGFDSDLQHLYSYNMNAKFIGGLSFESLQGYIDSSPISRIYVQCVFVTRDKYEKIKGNIEWYIANWKNSRYSIKNLFNIVVGKEDKTNRNLSMVCSQFVDSLFKLVNIDLTNKPSNLVTPANLVEVKNPTIYKLYEGEAKGYDHKKVQSMVDKLSLNAEPGRSTVYETAKSMYTDEVVLNIYEAIDKMLTAKDIFVETNIPFQIEDNGDLTISTYKNYELMYQETHTMLKSVDNTESLKDLMCRLWFLNCRLEKKIQVSKSKRKKDVALEYYKLRSRVLNDFNKYMKQIYKDEPDFNFPEYYKNSSYYDGSIVVKRSTLKGVGDFIKSFIKK